MKLSLLSFKCFVCASSTTALYSEMANRSIISCSQKAIFLNICFVLFSSLLFSDYLLSNNHVNSIIVHKFDFSDEEIMAYYISFLKTLSLKLNNHTVHFFYNEVRRQGFRGTETKVTLTIWHSMPVVLPLWQMKRKEGRDERWEAFICILCKMNSLCTYQAILSADHTSCVKTSASYVDGLI